MAAVQCIGQHRGVPGQVWSNQYRVVEQAWIKRGGKMEGAKERREEEERLDIRKGRGRGRGRERGRGTVGARVGERVGGSE
jgi:hypothetical protein